MRGHALVVDDEPQMLVAMDTALRRAGFNVTTAASGLEALEKVESEDFAVVFTDLRMPRLDGLQLLAKLKFQRADVPVVMMTAYGTIQNAVQAMKEGAADYLVKPFDARDVDAVIKRVVASSASMTSGEFLTATPAVRRLLAVARKAARSTATVLVEGESGTGKEVLARFIHSESSRKSRPFVAVNCAAIPDSLLESELFGHERGAFTGATMRREGKFELASGGTLLLDEIGEMPRELQAKLLRVLQEKTVDRIGGREPVPVDLRVVATTNVDLAAAVESADFRQDLYYRLKVVRLHLPPLRNRPEDIELLAGAFCAALGGAERSLSEPALKRLSAHAWPGNVRELKNVIECALTLSSSQQIQEQDLFLDGPESRSGSSAPRTVAEAEQSLILSTLEQTNGNRTRAAEQLGISIRTLRNKLGQYRSEGIEVAEPAGKESNLTVPSGKDSHREEHVDDVA